VSHHEGTRRPLNQTEQWGIPAPQRVHRQAGDPQGEGPVNPAEARVHAPGEAGAMQRTEATGVAVEGGPAGAELDTRRGQEGLSNARTAGIRTGQQ
jgi:hypothetical protein